MKVLITGINGFIGKHLAKSLNEHEVYGIDLEGDNKTIFACDITDENVVKKIVNKINPDIIFHLAAYLGRDDLELAMKINVQCTENLLIASNDQFIALDTSEGYTGDVPYTEDSEIITRSAYSKSKKAMYDLLMKSDKSVTVIRPSIVYGPGQIGSMFIPSMIKQLVDTGEFHMTKGEQTRDFIYVKDLCEALVACIGNAIGKTINIGSGKEIKLLEVAEIINSYLPGCVMKDLPYRENEQMRYCLDITKAKHILNWTPKTSLEEGLRKTIS